MADLDLEKVYEPTEAIKILKNNSYVKFNETIDVAINLGIDPSKTDQNVKGITNLPKGNGKKVIVAVIASEDKIDEAKSNGADIAGGKEIIDTLDSNGEDLLVVTESCKITLNSKKDKKLKIKSLSSVEVIPDNGLIDMKWESLHLDGDSCVEFSYVEDLSSWVIVSSDGLKNS